MTGFLLIRLLPKSPAQRWLAAGNFVSMVGTAATLSVLVVFLAETKHLGLGSAAALLSVTGLVGVVGAVPVGQLCDHFGARRVSIIAETVRASATVGILVFGGFRMLSIALIARQLAGSGNGTARSTLMGYLVPAEERAALRAYQRVVTNIGSVFGALLSALVIAIGDAAALYGVLVFDATTFLFAAYATSRLPEAGRRRHASVFAIDAVRDPGYLVAGALNAVHSLNAAIISAGIPLWVVYASRLPRWSVSFALVLNTAVVIALQVPLSKYSNSTAGAGRSLSGAGALTAAGCVALAAATPGNVVSAWLMLVVASTLLALGEILGAAAGWTLSYDLAKEHLYGQYQGMWQVLADGSAKAGGPVLVGGVVAAGPVGWTAMAGVFIAAAAATQPVIRWSSPGRRTGTASDLTHL